jgi:hypothetical protein
MCKKENPNIVLIDYISNQEPKSVSFKDLIEYKNKNNYWFGPYFNLENFLTSNQNLGIIKVNSNEGTISINKQ